MRLSRADLDAIRAIVRAEVATADRSGRRSSVGIGALVQGDDQCDEKERSEFMDRTSTETGGESLSLDQMATRLLSRSRAARKPKALRIAPARKQRGAR
jgi:hypothetical protein